MQTLIELLLPDIPDLKKNKQKMFQKTLKKNYDFI